MTEEITIEVDGHPVRLTHPDKVLFPEEGWTKLDVVEHYLGCGEGALRAVQDRPCLLKRPSPLSMASLAWVWRVRDRSYASRTGSERRRWATASTAPRFSWFRARRSSTPGSPRAE